MNSTFDYYKLHVEASDRFVVKGYGSYPKHSVNFGMTRICFLDSFTTEAEALEKYPMLLDNGKDSMYSNKFMDPSTDPGPIPPPGFDPADAGEQWDEDY